MKLGRRSSRLLWLCVLGGLSAACGSSDEAKSNNKDDDRQDAANPSTEAEPDGDTTEGDESKPDSDAPVDTYAVSGVLDGEVPAGSSALDVATCKLYVQEEMVSELDEGGAFEFSFSGTADAAASQKLTFVCRGYLPAVAEVDLSGSDLGTLVTSFKKPNVLLLVWDDLNDYLSFMKDKPSIGDGNPDSYTPNIDTLAARGVKFMNAHAQAPLCGPSRASMLYSQYPSTTGIYAQPDQEEYDAVRATTPDLIDYFNSNGYKTIGQGKVNHKQLTLDFAVGESRTRWGPTPDVPVIYDESNLVYNDGTVSSSTQSTMTDWGYWEEFDPDTGSRDVSSMSDYSTVDYAVDQLGQEHEGPFLMAVGLTKPHNPWIIPWEYNDRYPRDQIQPPVILENDWDDIPEAIVNNNIQTVMPPYDWMTEEGHEQERMMGILQSYLGSVAFADDMTGRLMDALANSAYNEDTIIIFTSDHGYHMGEKRVWQKHTLWRESTRVPFVVHIPNMPNTREVMTPVGLIDIYPTLAELCGFEPNQVNEGISLADVIYDPEASLSRKSIRTTWRRDNHSQTSERYHYVRTRDGSEELYDFIEDPFEHTNLTGSEYDAVKVALKADLPE